MTQFDNSDEMTAILPAEGSQQKDVAKEEEIVSRILTCKTNNTRISLKHIAGALPQQAVAVNSYITCTTARKTNLHAALSLLPKVLVLLRTSRGARADVLVFFRARPLAFLVPKHPDAPRM